MVTKVSVRLSDITYHCCFGLLVRILLSVYSLIHDSYFSVQYTDIDYKVYTHGAKEVLAQRSPYDAPTYRYSPIIAVLLTPNIIVHPIFGKMIASIFDVGLAACIYRIVELVYNNRRKALQCAQLWLYNPLPILICTRGNIDALSSVFILLTLLYHLKQNYYASGALLALSVHLRLYPVIFLLPLLITAGRYSAEDTLKLTYKSKLKFLTSFALVLAAVTGVFYYIYGYKFIDASILYHMFRTDTRHNFSLYFYVQYLDAFVPDFVSKNFPLLDPKITKNLLMIVPTVVLLIATAVKYNTLDHLSFASFCSAFIFVIFNRVLTAQYFIWYVSLLPLFLPSVILSRRKVGSIVSFWLITGGSWLLAAYLLEFKGYETYAYIHACSLSFFAVNVWILCTFINSYNAHYVKKIN